MTHIGSSWCNMARGGKSPLLQEIWTSFPFWKNCCYCCCTVKFDCKVSVQGSRIKKPLKFEEDMIYWCWPASIIVCDNCKACSSLIADLCFVNSMPQVKLKVGLGGHAALRKLSETERYWKIGSPINVTLLGSFLKGGRRWCTDRIKHWIMNESLRLYYSWMQWYWEKELDAGTIPGN